MAKNLSIKDLEEVLRNLPDDIKNEKIQDIQILSGGCGMKIDLCYNGIENSSKSIIVDTTESEDGIDVSIKCNKNATKKELKAGDYIVLLRDYEGRVAKGSTGAIVFTTEGGSALVDFGDVCTYVNTKDLEVTV